MFYRSSFLPCVNESAFASFFFCMCLLLLVPESICFSLLSESVLSDLFYIVIKALIIWFGHVIFVNFLLFCLYIWLASLDFYLFAKYFRRGLSQPEISLLKEVYETSLLFSLKPTCWMWCGCSIRKMRVILCLGFFCRVFWKFACRSCNCWRFPIALILPSVPALTASISCRIRVYKRNFFNQKAFLRIFLVWILLWKNNINSVIWYPQNVENTWSFKHNLENQDHNWYKALFF